MINFSNFNKFKTNLKSTIVFYDENSVIFKIFQKSRFVMKNTIKICEILDNLEKQTGKKFQNKYIIIDGKMCSKSKEFLSDWEITKNESF